LDDRPHTVVGVMPAGFAFPAPEMQAWLPLRLDLAEPFARNNKYLRVVTRARPETPLGALGSELGSLAARIREAHPSFYPERFALTPRPLKDEIVGEARTPLLLLLGAVAGLLLVASTNTAGLFLARGERRRTEIAIRSALGAARWRVGGQLLFESLMVALVAGAAGLGVAKLGVWAIGRLGAVNVPRLAEITVDLRVIGFGLSTALLTGVLFGLLPAVQAGRSEVRLVLASGGRGSIGARGATRFRRRLVVAQIALATVLLLGSMLLVRSLAATRGVQLGFQPAKLLVVPLAPTESAVGTDEPAAAFYRELETRIAALPGVVAVGSARRVPLADGFDRFSVHLDGRPETPVADAPAASIQWATGGYFEAAGIPLLAGRRFGPTDHADAPLVTVVSRSLADEWWPGEDPIGRRVRMWRQGSPYMEIVGVAEDVKHDGPQRSAPPTLYIPHLQGFRSGYVSPNRMSVFVRTETDPSSLAPAVRALVRELSASVPIGAVRTGVDLARRSVARDRFIVQLLGLFALAALLLGSIGVYAVIAQAVRMRTREFGLRMAMGASSTRLAREVLREGLRVGLQGAAIGLAAGALLSRQLRSILFGVSHLDPWAYAVAVPTIALVVLAASGLPARAAARLDPVRALEDDR
ncbi:MAG: ABC transporter permease, partial [Gemmatimonadetes bacterium]|nr:ABC transporter permease [Gemmatimonadota bacterium]